MFKAGLPTVIVFTCCLTEVLKYGSLLVFESLRVGFPSARIVVIDNGSTESVRKEIKAAASACGAEYRQQIRRHFTANLRWLLSEQKEFDRFVLIDPDIVFWESVEMWNFDDVLMAGRKIPLMRHSRIEAPRLHPSHLWIPDVHALRGEMLRISEKIPCADLFGFYESSGYFFDTISPLYMEIEGKTACFEEKHLDSYDHLFYGSHFPRCAGMDRGGVFIDAHRAAASGDLYKLKGIWKKQQKIFESFADRINSENLPPVGVSVMSAFRKIADAQGIDLTNSEIVNADSVLSSAVSVNFRARKRIEVCDV